MRSRQILRITFLLLFFSAANASAENSTEIYKRGARLAKSGKIDEAILIFKDVIAQNPYYSLGHYGLGKAYLFKKGMLYEAVRHLKLSVQLDRRFAGGYFYLGLAYYLYRKYPYAINAFDRAYRIDSNYIESILNIALIYEKMEKYVKAAQYFEMYKNIKRRRREGRLF